MCTNHWPMFLDLSRDECKKILRRLELEAYSSVITAFRAQGDLTKDKKGILQQLQNLLSISTERHRAEVRRATNDEKLATIADNMGGPDISSEWSIEGRRLVPLMPRLVPQTAFTVTANSAANLQAEKNLALPSPSQTGNKDPNNVPPPPPLPPPPPPAPAPVTPAPKVNRPSSPGSNVVVLPSGMSIHIKGNLSGEEDEVTVAKKRRRSNSASESVVVPKTTSMITTVPTTKVIQTSAVVAASQSVSSPMKITFTKSPAKSHTTVTPSQKVILVSSSQSGGSSSNTAPNILQRSLNVPVVKATSTVTMTTSSLPTQPRSSVVIPSTCATATSVSNGNLGNIITVATTNAIVSTAGMAQGSPYITSSLSAIKPRTKTITTTRPRAPQAMTSRGGVMIPIASQPVQPSPQNIQIKSVTNISKPTIHIKQEGGMKIITQGIPGGTSKILPKPVKPANVAGTPGMVVSTAPSSITMVTKTVAGHMQAGRVLNITSPAGAHMGTGRVLNITSQGGRMIATTSRTTTANVVTVNPKTLQLSAIKGATGASDARGNAVEGTARFVRAGQVLTTAGRVATATGAKPNVIVVQKAQPKRGTPTTPTIQVSKSSPFEKELMSFIQKQDIKKVIERKPIAPKPSTSDAPIQKKQMPVVVRQKIDPNDPNKSTLLAELIQAVGIMPDGSAAPEIIPEQQEVIIQEEAATGPMTIITSTGQIQAEMAGGISGSQWVEFDDPQHIQQTEVTDSMGIKSLLQSGQQVRTRVITSRPSTLELSHMPQQIQIQHADSNMYSIAEESMSLVNKAGEHHQQQQQQPQQQAVTSADGQIHYIDLSMEDQKIAEACQVQEEVVTTAMEPVTSGAVLTGPSGPVQVQLAAGDLSQLTSLGQEVIGELDPQTGIFYASSRAGTQTASISAEGRIFAASSVSVTQPVSTITSQPQVVAKPIDFLSSALTQAQIDLDPYQFIEEDGSTVATQVVTTSQETVVSTEGAAAEVVVSEVANVPPVTPQPTTSLVSILNPVSGTHVFSTPQSSQDVDSQELSQGSESVIIETEQVPSEMMVMQGEEVIEQSEIIEQSEVVSTTADVEVLQPEADLMEPVSTVHIEQQQQQRQQQQQPKLQKTVMVTTQPSTTVVTILDRTPEPQIEEEHMSGTVVTSSEMSSSSEASHHVEAQTTEGEVEIYSSDAQQMGSDLVLDPLGLRTSKRKRKPRPAPDDSPPPLGPGGWVRFALGLLHKVCKFRGSKEKGEMNASVWFLQPVSREEVPDYYDIVKTPMDFSTIKKKLESGQYESWEDFDDEMTLVRDNCCLYNPPGNAVRKDCDEVFAYYSQEYERTLERYHKSQSHLTNTPSPKKPKVIGSPIRQ